jgi:hypothetical protein
MVAFHRTLLAQGRSASFKLTTAAPDAPLVCPLQLMRRQEGDIADGEFGHKDLERKRIKLAPIQNHHFNSNTLA